MNDILVTTFQTIGARRDLGATLADTSKEVYDFYLETPTFQDYIHGTILFFAIFLLYIETRIKGIFFRPNSTGKTAFNPLGFTGFLTYPFTSSDPWRIENWDLNYIIFTQIGALWYTLLQSFY